MGYWKRHQKKDVETLLEEFDGAGWRIEDPPTYYTVKCPCGHHHRFIHLTPSGPNYAKNARKWLTWWTHNLHPIRATYRGTTPIYASGWACLSPPGGTPGPMPT